MPGHSTPNPKFVRPALVAAVLVIASCRGMTDPISGTWRGRFVHGFESSSFTPCGYPAQGWWVSFGNAEASAKYRSLAPQEPNLAGSHYETYVEWGGERSRLGAFGHLGSYGFEFRVDEVLTVRLPSDTDCR